MAQQLKWPLAPIILNKLGIHGNEGKIICLMVLASMALPHGKLFGNFWLRGISKVTWSCRGKASGIASLYYNSIIGNTPFKTNVFRRHVLFKHPKIKFIFKLRTTSLS